ncbi:globin domain-containing protein [Embleya sp. NPDC001921]
MDANRLEESWRLVTAHGDQVPLFFYSSLFLADPRTRQMFPVSMAAQRGKLIDALGTIVSQVEDMDRLADFLGQLGRDHRRFAVVAEHYPAVGTALLATLEHFTGAAWTPQLADDWRTAYARVAKVMCDAADESARTTPPWWDAEVVRHERRGLGLVVLTVRPDTRLDFDPGQSVAVETALRPRMWRYFSPANAPRADGTLELHVRVVDGGSVSTALAQGVRQGDLLRLGAPVGRRLTLGGTDGRDVVLLAGGTGLAPFKALIERIGIEHDHGSVRRRAVLYMGARRTAELYDAAAMFAYAEAFEWLTVIPAISEEPSYRGEIGDPVDVALRHGPWGTHEVYLCGSPELMRSGLGRLRSAGLPEERLRFEEFGGHGISGPSPTYSSTEGDHESSAR